MSCASVLQMTACMPTSEFSECVQENISHNILGESTVIDISQYHSLKMSHTSTY